VTGFAKRKQARREYGAIQAAKKARVARNQLRKERRDAMKIQDRVTGAFGDKHSDDSDDELGEGAKGLEGGFPKQQQPQNQKQQQQKQGNGAAASAAAAAAAPKQAVHEDDVAVVTVRTREHDSDAEGSDDDEDEDEEEDDVDPNRPAGSSSTPYNPSQKHQARATQLARAKSIIKTKDGFRKRGMSSKGGHKFKHPKICSKKKKAQGKKGASKKG
jgi:hypothetical protein